jgi:hypothetical protein
MQDEAYPRRESDSAPSESPDGMSASSGWMGQVESVPSEQLWRAAILAARQAALSAAELRRVLEQRGTPVVPPDGSAAQLLT